MDFVVSKEHRAAADSSSCNISDDVDDQEVVDIMGEEEEEEVRRGPWTVEEDFILMNYITSHGEGRWNSLARCAGLKRTGKSCRLRWLNYLRPDVRRGNITLEEQLLILELHSRWGNRWSKIAQHLPGRTDNEIKNYWRTRVQKHAKQLKCDVNSKQFKDTMRYIWMPRLVERIQAAASSSSSNGTTTINNNNNNNNNATNYYLNNSTNTTSNSNNNNSLNSGLAEPHMVLPLVGIHHDPAKNSFATTSENSSMAVSSSSESVGTQVSPVSDMTDFYGYPVNSGGHNQDYSFQQQGNYNNNQVYYPEMSLTSPCGYFNQGLDFQTLNINNANQFWMMEEETAGDLSDNLWNVDDIWFLQQQHQQQQQLSNNFNTMG